MKPFPPLVVSVILNTNRREDTLACLESLEQSNYPRHRILVLDNRSTDGSIAAIHARYPQVELIELSENKGYTGNNNVGILTALEMGADWVFVLNEDITIAPDALSQLMETAEADEKIGIIGPLVLHADEPQTIQSAGGLLNHKWTAYHRGQNEADTGQYSQPEPVDWISGCGILVRRAVIQQIGMLDERLFYYWEETEWCMRAARGGWKIVIEPRARLWHKGVQRDYRPGPNVTYYLTRNRLMAFQKHHASFAMWAAAYWTAARTLLSWSIRPKWRGKREHRNALWQGLLDFWQGRTGMRPSNTRS